MTESKRIAELHSYEILDTDEEFSFDDITEFASKVLDVTYVFINLIDKNRQWAKSAAGLPREAAECDRNDSFCINPNPCLLMRRTPQLTIDREGAHSKQYPSRLVAHWHLCEKPLGICALFGFGTQHFQPFWVQKAPIL